jgi:hypothetical protein
LRCTRVAGIDPRFSSHSRFDRLQPQEAPSPARSPSFSRTLRPSHSSLDGPVSLASSRPFTAILSRYKSAAIEGESSYTLHPSFCIKSRQRRGSRTHQEPRARCWPTATAGATIESSVGCEVQFTNFQLPCTRCAALPVAQQPEPRARPPQLSSPPSNADPLASRYRSVAPLGHVCYLRRHASLDRGVVRRR